MEYFSSVFKFPSYNHLWIFTWIEKFDAVCPAEPSIEIYIFIFKCIYQLFLGFNVYTMKGFISVSFNQLL